MHTLSSVPILLTIGVYIRKQAIKDLSTFYNTEPSTPSKTILSCKRYSHNLDVTHFISKISFGLNSF